MTQHPEQSESHGSISDKTQIVIGSVISVVLVGAYLIFSEPRGDDVEAESRDCDPSPAAVTTPIAAPAPSEAKAESSLPKETNSSADGA